MMKNNVLKDFIRQYKDYLIETDHSANTAGQYCTYLRKACAFLNLGEGFLEVIAATKDLRVQTALSEFIMAKLCDAFESGSPDIPKKHISNYKSAIAMLAAFLVDGDTPATTPSTGAPAISLPCESVYTQQDMKRIFKQRLATQDRYYSNSCFPVRILSKINTKSVKKDIYKNIIANTRFLYDKDPCKFFRLSEITKLTIKSDGFVKMEVKGKEYDVYTEVYVKGVSNGYEPFRAESFALLSLDHIKPIHSELQTFLAEHEEFRKFSDSVISHKALCGKMAVSQFSRDYLNTVYPSTGTDERALIDEVGEFIDSLELSVLHRGYNSSKNDNV